MKESSACMVGARNGFKAYKGQRKKGFYVKQESLAMKEEAIAILVGFVTGTASAGLAFTVALTGFVALIADPAKGGTLEANVLLSLSAGMIVLGGLLAYGGLLIWRFSVHGGALNLGLSIISILLVVGHSNALAQFQSSQATLFYYWFLYPSIVITSISSGLAGVYAHREQIYKRLTPPKA